MISDESKAVFKEALDSARAELKELLAKRAEKIQEIDKLRHLCHNLDILLLPDREPETLRKCYIKWFPDSPAGRSMRRSMRTKT